MIRQLPVKGGRGSKVALLDPQLEAWVLAEARRYGVGASFVLNNVVSIVSGIPLLYGGYKQAKTRDVRMTAPALVVPITQRRRRR